MNVKLIIVITGVALLTACLENNRSRQGGNTDISGDSSLSAYQAALVTVDADYSGSAVQIADVNRKEKTIGLSDELIALDQSDYTVSAYGDSFYHIGRYNIDLFYRYHFMNPQQQILQGDAGPGFDLLQGEQSLNTQQMIVVNPYKAYLINYDVNQIWIVNPSATQESNFKLGEIDLSAYADGDSTGIDKPEMHSAMLVNGKLFVLMQRLKDWCPEEPDAYLAVIDVNTDLEVDTNSGNDSKGLKGIRLQVKNPSSLDFHPSTGLVVAGAAGGTVFCAMSDVYSGGIEYVDVVNYQTQLAVDDGGDYYNITSVEVVDARNAYFVSYVAWGDTKLFHFNPFTRQVYGVVPGFGDSATVDIRLIEQAPDGSLWVGTAQNPADAGSSPMIYILDGANQSLLSSFALNRNPEAVAFANVR